MMTTTVPDVDLAELVGDVEIECCKNECTALATWLVLGRCGGCHEVLDAPSCDEHTTRLVELMALGVIRAACCRVLVTLVSVNRI